MSRENSNFSIVVTVILSAVVVLRGLVGIVATTASFLPVLYLPLTTFLLKVRRTGYALNADAVSRHVSQPKLK